MKQTNVRRARLVSDEMLLSQEFDAAVRQIDVAISRYSTQTVKRRIKTLMNRLLATPTEQTVDFFIEMHRRWNHLHGIHVVEYLEQNWQSWATWEDRLELIWHKFSHEQISCGLIQAVYSQMQRINPDDCSLLSKERLRTLIRSIVEFEGDLGLRIALLKVIGTRYRGLMAIERYVRNLFRTRYASEKPDSPLLKQIRRLLAWGLYW